MRKRTFIAKLKKVVHDILENPDYRFRHAIDVVLIILILASIVTYLWELSLPLDSYYIPLFELLNNYFLTLFVIEYLLRFWIGTDFIGDIRFKYVKEGKPLSFAIAFAIKNKIAWILSPASLLDLMGIIPFLRISRMFRIFRIFRIFRLARFAMTSNVYINVFKKRAIEISFLFIISTFIIIFSAVMVFTVEKTAGNDQFSSLKDALWWSVVTLTTVGYGDKYPVTTIGRFFASVIMFVGIGIIALPAGIIGSSLTEEFKNIKEGKVILNKLRDHILILGWNTSASRIIDELDKRGVLLNHKLVVVTTLEDIDDDRIIYKRGDPSKEKDLIEAGIKNAYIIVILSEDISGNIRNPDASVMITAMLAKKLNSTSHIIVEIIDVQNAELLENNLYGIEIIYREEISIQMIVNSIYSPGAGKIITTLLNYNYANIYETSIKSLKGEFSTFGDLYKYLGEEERIIPIGIIDDGGYVVNPPRNYPLEENARVVYIAEKELI